MLPNEKGYKRIDLADPEERAKAVAEGYIWAGPDAAIEHALRDIRDGLIPPPHYIPREWAVKARSMGIETRPLGDGEPGL